MRRVEAAKSALAEVAKTQRVEALALEERVLMDGRVYVGSTRWAGTVGFRPAFVNWRTTAEDAALVVEVVRDLGREIRA